jgi:uncharacterized Tic20 family protein
LTSCDYLFIIKEQGFLNELKEAKMPLTESEEKTFGMLCHLAALAGFLIPMGHIIGPLVIWLIKKPESAFVDDQGKESLNFQITMTIFAIISCILMFVLIGFVLIIAVGIFLLVMVIIASVKANQGIKYRYPINIRIIK